MDVEKEIEDIKYRMDLLFQNTSSSRMLYEYDFTKIEGDNLIDYIQFVQLQLENRTEITRGGFEAGVYSAVPRMAGNYGFCEAITEYLYEEGRFTIVFEKIYQ